MNALVATADENNHALPRAARLADKIQARPKNNTINEVTHTLPYAARMADKIQPSPKKHTASLRCRLLRLQTKLGTPSNKTSDARVRVPAAQCGCSERLAEDNCNDTAACQPSLCKEYRFVGGGLAPAFTSPSQPTDSNAASLPVCILCLRDAPDYVPKQHTQCEVRVRFQGGGVETLQCFICLAWKGAYVPQQLSDEYVTHCRTCGRGACNSHGSWEVGCFHCALCDANDGSVVMDAKDT